MKNSEDCARGMDMESQLVTMQIIFPDGDGLL